MGFTLWLNTQIAEIHLGAYAREVANPASAVLILNPLKKSDEKLVMWNNTVPTREGRKGK